MQITVDEETLKGLHLYIWTFMGALGLIPSLFVSDDHRRASTAEKGLRLANEEFSEGRKVLEFSKS